MWIVADLFERYTTGVAKTFLRIAAREADANRKALDDYRQSRENRAARVVASDRLNVQTRATPDEARKPEPDAKAVEALPVVALVPAAQTPTPPEPPVAVEAQPADAIDAQTTVAANAPTDVEQPELPMGVRGDVVARWVGKLVDAAPGEIADLVETLRKDKKVRVAELQWIAVGALNEEPAIRKKADHLAVMRERLGLAPASGTGPAASDGALSLHA